MSKYNKKSRNEPQPIEVFEIVRHFFIVCHGAKVNNLKKNRELIGGLKLLTDVYVRNRTFDFRHSLFYFTKEKTF